MCDISFENARGSRRGGEGSKHNECLCWSSRAKGSLKKMLREISQNSQENTCAGIAFLVFSCEFCEICKNIFFVEQHWTTASDYSSIKSSEGGVLANVTVNYDTKTKAYILIWARSASYLKGAVLVKEQVSEAVVCKPQIRCSQKFCKFHWRTSLLESLFNKAAGLKCFPVKFAKFLRTPSFTEEFQRLLLRFKSYF